MRPTFVADYPKVIDQVRVDGIGSILVEHGDEQLNVDHTLLAGASFFKMFSFPLVAGKADDALDEPMKVVLSHTVAKRLFGTAREAIGQTLIVYQAPMTVTAVAEDTPDNSSIKFDMLIWFITVKAMGRDLETWRGDWLTSFVLLKPGTDAALLDAQVPAFLERYTPNRAEYGNELYLHPFADSHLGSNHITFGDGITVTSDIRYVYIFSAVGLFVLVACYITRTVFCALRSHLSLAFLFRHRRYCCAFSWMAL
jgi:putative ABC transport system permease protein